MIESAHKQAPTTPITNEFIRGLRDLPIQFGHLFAYGEIEMSPSALSSTPEQLLKLTCLAPSQSRSAICENISQVQGNRASVEASAVAHWITHGHKTRIETIE